MGVAWDDGVKVEIEKYTKNIVDIVKDLIMFYQNETKSLLANNENKDAAKIVFATGMWPFKREDGLNSLLGEMLEEWAYEDASFAGITETMHQGDEAIDNCKQFEAKLANNLYLTKFLNDEQDKIISDNLPADKKRTEELDFLSDSDKDKLRELQQDFVDATTSDLERNLQRAANKGDDNLMFKSCAILLGALNKVINEFNRKVVFPAVN